MNRCNVCAYKSGKGCSHPRVSVWAWILVKLGAVCGFKRIKA
jgi:hypothetical protein